MGRVRGPWTGASVAGIVFRFSRLLRLEKVLLIRRLAILFSLTIAATSVAVCEKPWVSQDANGRLLYRTLSHGDRIIDFSYAGYMGGGVPLPKVPSVRTLTPSGTDDSVAIQKAIDEISAQTAIDHKWRAVQLAVGTFLCSKTLYIHSSGVVLRGSGSSSAGSGTTLQLTGEPHTAIEIRGNLKSETIGAPAHIIQPYVPANALTIELDDVSSFGPGDTIRITRPVTQRWLHLMGMDKMVRDGKDEIWVGNSISTFRTVVRRQQNVLTLDVPLTDSYDRAYLPPDGAEVIKVNASGAIEQDAVESLHIVAPARQIGFTDPSFRAINLYDVRDAWLRDLLIEDATEGVDVGTGSSRITIQEVGIRHTTAVTTSAKPADFALRGTQTLMLRCGSIGNDLFYVITGARNQGPNVVLDSIFRGDGRIQPHQRWSTGFLVDNTRVPEGGIDLMNRGELGSGQGWTVGWSVVWNSAANSLIIQNPPGSANWSIGTSGNELGAPMKIKGEHRRDEGHDLPEGYIESPKHPVVPSSLYRQQLSDRLGSGAVSALNP